MAHSKYVAGHTSSIQIQEPFQNTNNNVHVRTIESVTTRPATNYLHETFFQQTVGYEPVSSAKSFSNTEGGSLPALCLEILYRKQLFTFQKIDLR